MNYGSYPAGADYDPRAPWLQPDPHVVKCEACNGKGKHWYAYNIEQDTVMECSEEDWNSFPDSEEEAKLLKSKYIKSDVEICEVCDGTGEIEYEEDYEPDYDERL